MKDNPDKNKSRVKQDYDVKSGTKSDPSVDIHNSYLCVK